MNQIIIKGRLTADPELKYAETRKGSKPVCNFTVAVDRTYGEETDFFRVQAWDKTAEFIEKHFYKGKEILVQGSMVNNPYEKDGTRVQFWQLSAQQVEFCGKKEDTNNGANQAGPEIPEGFQAVEDDEDIPF